MKKVILMMSLVILSLGSFAEVKRVEIYFDVASSEISVSELEKINSLENGNLFLIKGHTDSDGNDAYNQMLSKNRVNSVYDALTSLGISPSKIDKKYFGERRPVNQNLTAKEKQANRRVEIIYDTDFLLQNVVETQKFTVLSNSLVDFTTANHLNFTIQPNTFTEDVTLEIREYFSLEEILANKLSTELKDGRLLKTGGMFHITALNNNGDELQPSKNIKIGTEDLKLEAGFELFDGNRNDQLVMEWETIRQNQTANNVNQVDLDLEETNNIISQNTIRYEGWQYNTIWFGCSLNNTKSEAIKPVNKWLKFSSDKVRNLSALYPNSPITKSKFSFKYNFQKGNVSSQFIVDSLDLTTLRNPKTEEAIALAKEYKEIHNELKKMANEYLKQEKIKATSQPQYLEIYVSDYKSTDYTIPIFESNRNQKSYIKNFNLPKLGWINIDMLLKEKENVTLFVNAKEKVDLRIILKEYDAYVSNYQYSGTQAAFDLPINEPIILIATINTERGKYVAKHELIAKNMTLEKLVFKPFDEVEFYNEMLADKK